MITGRCHRDRPIAWTGWDVDAMTGEQGQERRTQNIVDFHDDPACHVGLST